MFITSLAISHSKPLRMSALSLILCAVISPISTSMAQSDRIAQSRVILSCGPIDGRLLQISRLGNGQTRNAEVAVVELTEPDNRLRVLHHVSTGAAHSPFKKIHSRCGRFLILLDEWSGAGVSPRDVVIYDLVRKEHAAYSIGDFLSEETVASLEPHPLALNGVEWCRISAFDYQRMEFYPTIPRECRRLNLPFVVVDLLTREVREEAVPEREIDPYWPGDAYFPKGRWICSMGDQPLPPAGEPMRLPAFLRVEYGDEGDRQRRVYRLDVESGDFLAVPEADWPDEKLPLIRNGMYQHRISDESHLQRP